MKGPEYYYVAIRKNEHWTWYDLHTATHTVEDTQVCADHRDGLYPQLKKTDPVERIARVKVVEVMPDTR